MSKQAQAQSETTDGPIMVILKREVLQRTKFRPHTPEYAMLQKLADEPHEAQFCDEDGCQWCRVEGKPRILARCFDVVGEPAIA